MRAGRAVMACIHAYDSPVQVGGQHLARCLVRQGWEVAYLSAPVSPLHLPLLGSPLLQSRMANWLASGRRAEDGRLWHYTPFALAVADARPLLRSLPLARGWHRLSLPGLAGRLSQQGFHRPDLLYLDNILYPFLFDMLEPARSVFRVADRHTAFPGWGGTARALAEEIATKADLTVYAAHDLEEYARALGPRRMLALLNGVDFARFAAAEGPDPELLRAIPRPRAIYVGAMDEWFDAALLRHAAERLPQVSFVLAGPRGKAADRLGGLPNVHLPGLVPHAELPLWLKHSDAGLIPFDMARRPELVRGVRPLKLLEYMSCGLPVVATRWPELERVGGWLALCQDAEAFTEGLRQALAAGAPRPENIAIASRCDWTSAAARMLEALEEP